MPKPTAPQHFTPPSLDQTSASAGLRQRIAELYRATESSGYVFGSPLDSFVVAGRTYELPRFVYFGERWSDVAIRLAMYAGFDGREVRTTEALLDVITTLNQDPHLGEGLNVHFFPLVNPTGLERSTRPSSLGLELLHDSWAASVAPELQALSRDIRQQAYQGFITLETADINEARGSLRLGTRPGSLRESRPTLAESLLPALPLQLLSPQATATGPLTLVPDLPASAFELRLQLPAEWDSHQLTQTISYLVTDFITRYRAHVCYGLHL